MKKLFIPERVREIVPHRVIEFSKIGRLDCIKEDYLFFFPFKYFMHILMHISRLRVKVIGSETVKTYDDDLREKMEEKIFVRN